MAASRKIVYVILLILRLLDIGVAYAANQVHGDQDVGGINLFEFHSTSGGVGMGWKILVIVSIVILDLYPYIHHRMR